MLMWSYPHISETCFLWPLLGTGYIICQRLKWDFSTLGKGWGGKLSDFFIFYCMVIELDIGSTFYAKLMCFWWLFKKLKLDTYSGRFGIRYTHTKSPTTYF
jgi:hypothetical protein